MSTTAAAEHPTARLKMLAHELTKFGIVGGLAFIVDFGVFNALHFGAGVGPVSSKAISTVISAAFAYVGNRIWAFKHRSTEQGSRELSLFVALNVIGLVITEVFIGGNHYVLGLTGVVATNLALVVGTGVATIFRFWAYRRWVFRHPEDVPIDLVERDELEAQAVLQV